MKDTIHITNLRLRTTLGIFDWERKIKQDITINLAITTDIKKAANTDNIENTTDYKAITKHIITFVEASNFYLIEKLVTEIAKLIITDYDIEKVKIRVDKPGALRFADTVGIEIEREKSDFK